MALGPSSSSHCVKSWGSHKMTPERPKRELRGGHDREPRPQFHEKIPRLKAEGGEENKKSDVLGRGGGEVGAEGVPGRAVPGKSKRKQNQRQPREGGEWGTNLGGREEGGGEKKKRQNSTWERKRKPNVNFAEQGGRGVHIGWSMSPVPHQWDVEKQAVAVVISPSEVPNRTKPTRLAMSL